MAAVLSSLCMYSVMVWMLTHWTMAVFLWLCSFQLAGGGALRRRGDPEPEDLGADMRIDPGELQLQDELVGQTYMEVMMRPVPVQYFTQRMESARSYHDILRIFYGDYLSNDNIDSIISTQPMHPQTYGTIMGRPRIGGLSDTMSFSVDQPTLEGIFHQPSLMLDGPKSRSPIASSSMNVSESEVSLRHQKRRRKKKKVPTATLR